MEWYQKYHQNPKQDQMMETQAPNNQIQIQQLQKPIQM